MEGQIGKKRKRYRKKNSEYLDTTILTGTVVFFISTRFYLFSFGSISINEIRQFVADIQPAKMDGISAVFILVPLARPPPHFGLISKNNYTSFEHLGQELPFPKLKSTNINSAC